MDENNLALFANRLFEESGVSEEDKLTIQIKLWRLLAHRTELYTAGDSSSVPIEIAQELLSSITFSIQLYANINGLHLKYLAAADMDGILSDAIKMLKKKIEFGKQLYQTAYQGLPQINNRSLTDTMKGIAVFFKKYDYYFFAHQIPGNIDYQLCKPVSDSFCGIEYITQYLCRLMIENNFLQCFEKDTVVRLLSAYCPDYKGLLINLFDPILTNAIGLVLARGDIYSLTITEEMRREIAEMFYLVPDAEAKTILRDAAKALSQSLGISGAAEMSYITQAAEDLYYRMEASLPSGNLGGVFLTFS